MIKFTSHVSGRAWLPFPDFFYQSFSHTETSFESTLGGDNERDDLTVELR